MTYLPGGIYESHNEEDTYCLGRDFAEDLTGGEIILLNGELGVGKTVFVRGMAKTLGIKDSITSPTFTLMNCYQGERINLCHIDAYRLKSGMEAYEAGLTEYFGLKNTVCCIEWSENIADAIVGKIIKVNMRYSQKNENYREIKIKNDK